MSLTLEEANRILAGALAKARELNIRVSAAVCDSGGRLIALQRGRLYRTKHTVRCIKAEVFIRFQPNNLYRNRFVAAFPKA